MEESTKSFWGAYWKFLGIAVGLFLLATIFYSRAYRDPRATDQQVTAVVAGLNSLYSKSSTNQEKRQVVIEDLLNARELDIRSTIYEHLAEAFILAGIMIITVEGLTRLMASKEAAESTKKIGDEFEEKANEIKDSVWEAIFDRLVRKEISREIETVLKFTVSRIRPVYTVTLKQPKLVGLNSNEIVVNRKLNYAIRNLTGAKIPDYVIPVKVLTERGPRSFTDAGGNTIQIPRICAVSLDGKEVDLTKTDRLNFAEPRTLPKMEDESDGYAVYSEVEEVFSTTDRALYIVTAPCVGIELNVVNEIPEIVKLQTDAVYLTSGLDRLHKVGPSNWSYGGALLPGTALSLSWTAIKTPA